MRNFSFIEKLNEMFQSIKNLFSHFYFRVELHLKEIRKFIFICKVLFCLFCFCRHWIWPTLNFVFSLNNVNVACVWQFLLVEFSKFFSWCSSLERINHYSLHSEAFLDNFTFFLIKSEGSCKLSPKFTFCQKSVFISSVSKNLIKSHHKTLFNFNFEYSWNDVFK